MSSERGKKKFPVVDREATAERLKALRRANGISVKELARICWCSRSTVYGWERGCALPTVYDMVTLSALYCCRVDDLIITTI